MFFYREPEENKPQEDDAIAAAEYGGDYTTSAITNDWNPQIPEVGQWQSDAAPIPAAPGGWTQDQGLLLTPPFV